MFFSDISFQVCGRIPSKLCLEFAVSGVRVIRYYCMRQISQNIKNFPIILQICVVLVDTKKFNVSILLSIYVQMLDKQMYLRLCIGLYYLLSVPGITYSNSPEYRNYEHNIPTIITCILYLSKHHTTWQ